MAHVVGHCFDAAIECALRTDVDEEAWWAPVVDRAALVCKRMRDQAMEAGRGAETAAHVLLYARLRGNLLRNANYLLDGVPPVLRVAPTSYSLSHATLLRCQSTKRVFEPLLRRAAGQPVVFATRGALWHRLRGLGGYFSPAECEQVARLALPCEGDVPALLRVLVLAVQIVVAQICDCNEVPRCFRADCMRPAVACGCPSMRVRTARMLPWTQFVDVDAAEQRYWRGCAGSGCESRVSVCSETCLRAYRLEVQARVPFCVPLVPRDDTVDLHAKCDVLMKRNGEVARALRDAPRVSGHLRASHVAHMRRELVRTMNVDTLLVYAAAVAEDARVPNTKRSVATFARRGWRKNFKKINLQMRLHKLLTQYPEMHLVPLSNRLANAQCVAILSQVASDAVAMFRA